MMDIKESGKKRLFIAIDLAEDVKTLLYNRAKQLFEKDSDIRPVALSNIHLTLRFLGWTFPDRIKKISEAVKKTASEIKKFDFTLGKEVGAFPDERHARIIFLPVSSGEETLNTLFDILDENFSKIKIRKEQRKFIAHLTIARIKNIKNIVEIFKVQELGTDTKIECKKITVFESLLKPTGAEYVILDEFELK